MREHPLRIYEKLDPELLKYVEGVKSLAQQALESGATKEEITEALRVAQYLSGAG
ncbi:MAG: hypothetical protein OIN88_07225 [Candidatus Methanoperedens sp.]|nr:hypothetical protein [Candidatus Methanoperedens sp.]